MHLKEILSLASRTVMLAGLTTLGAASALGQSEKAADVKNVVLVHGAWANGSSWAKVIPRLEAKGYHVVAVQLPLTSLTDDVAAVNRALKLEDGPVVLVGHSYGGAVITEAGNDPKVKALVYVAAFAPDRGESAFGISKAAPQVPIGNEIRPDDAGFLKITPKGIFEDFGQDLSESEKQVLAATQGPTSVNALGGNISVPAWKSKPSSYIVASQDRAVSPELEKQTAAKINADVTVVSSSHLVMLSHPDEVTAVILQAAGGKTSH
jgi:pimeloyl-ACP methyl ester carboxylesterase